MMSVNMLFSVMSLISAPVTIFTVPCSLPGPPQSPVDKAVAKVKGYDVSVVAQILKPPTICLLGSAKVVQNNDLVIGATSGMA